MNDWIDITRPLKNGMIQWPGDPVFQWQWTSRISGPGSCNLSVVRMGMHTGTHIDAPLHFIRDGADIAALSLEQLCGPAVVVDIGEPRDVSASDLEDAWIREGERVLLRTVNGQLWSKSDFDESFYGISAGAAEWLVDHRVPVVGVDYLSVDRYHDRDKPAHYVLLGAGIPVIEGLDLSCLGPGRYEMVALPLNVAGAEGSPARVIVRPLAMDGVVGDRS